jgi:hypothetical protein
MAKESARKDDDDLDYEVVDDKPRRKSRDEDDDRPRRKSRDEDEDNRPRARTRDDDEDEDDRPRKKRRDDDEDDRPRAKRRDDEDDDDRPRKKRPLDDGDDDRPRKKKKVKKKRSSSLYDDLEDRDKPIFDVGDWVMSGLLFSTGLILSFMSSVGIAGTDHAFKALGVMFLGLIVLIPLVVGTLMIVGMLVGIDYGEYKSAIIKLTAVATFNNGLLWLAQWIGIPWFVAIAMCGIFCFGLFMGLFELDTWETNISLAAINGMQFLARLLLMSIAFAQARHEARRGSSSDDDRPPINNNNGNGNPNFDDGGDDGDEEMPGPKGKGPRKGPPFGQPPGPNGGPFGQPPGPMGQVPGPMAPFGQPPGPMVPNGQFQGQPPQFQPGNNFGQPPG